MGVKWRNNLWYIRFWINKKEVFMSTKATSKRKAQAIEHAAKSAIRSGNYAYLDDEAREVLIRFFRNRGLEIPVALLACPDGTFIQPELQETLTLERAAKMCYEDADVQSKSSLYRERFKQCCAHILERLLPGTPVKGITVSHVRRYCKNREDEGAAPATINKEKGILSKIFRYLIENELADRNPTQFVKPRDEKIGRRRAYISSDDFERIVEALPEWYRPMAWTAYYTGMRQGEVRELTRSQVDLEHRMIRLTPEDTKEARWKSVPINKTLVPILKNVLSGGLVVGMDKVFLRDGIPIPRTHMRRLWESAVKQIGYPGLHFHDIRHTFKVNCRASGVDEEIRRCLMGHANRAGSVHEGYGILGDQELVRAIDMMTFDHGYTDIWVATKKENLADATAGLVSGSAET